MQETKTSTFYSRRLRSAVVALLGGVCVQCGFSDVRALQIDHVNGGGSADRKARGSWSNHQIYREIVKSEGKTAKYQLLCANCNWIKRVVLGEHPTSK